MGITFIAPPSLGEAKAHARAEVFAAALARELREPVHALVAKSYAEVEQAASDGTADILWCPSAVCAKLKSTRAIFTIVRNGHSTYRSALIARRTDRRNTASLAKTSAAWVDPLSAGGYLLVKAMLEARGLNPEKTFASQRFVGSHKGVIEALLDGAADVGAVSANASDEAGLVLALRWYATAAAERLEAIAVTERCPNDALVISSKTREELARRFETLFGRSTLQRARILAAFEADSFVVNDGAAYRRAFNPR